MVERAHSRGKIFGAKEFDGISREQARAFIHATGPEGLAIIDGQAGTGKSFSMAAIRKAYEAQGLQRHRPRADQRRRAGHGARRLHPRRDHP